MSHFLGLDLLPFSTIQKDAFYATLAVLASASKVPKSKVFILEAFLSISCHALTPNILGSPSAYGMHAANSNTFMLIYIHMHIY